METKEFEFRGTVANGFLMLFANLAVLGLVVVGIVESIIEYGYIVKPYLGVSVVPVSEELQTRILGEGGKPIDCRIEDAKRTGEDFAKAKEALGDLARTEEDVMSYICFPDQAKKFLEARRAKRENIATYTITEADAEAILDFVPDDALPLMVHCTAGIARSGAVGEVLDWYYNCWLTANDEDHRYFLRENRQVMPNSTVRRLLMRVLQRRVTAN